MASVLLGAGFAMTGCSGDEAGDCSGAILEESRANSPIVLNEVKVKSADETTDWIELKNVSGSDVDLGCWSIIDKSAKHTPFYVAPGSTVGPGGYVSLHRDKTGRTGFKWGFGDNDIAILRDPDGRIADETSWDAGQAQAGNSWGRFPDGTGEFQTLPQPTLKATNAQP